MNAITQYLRRHVVWLALLGFLAGCAGLLVPGTISFSDDDMQQALQRKFPVEKSYLGLVDMTLTHPQVSSDPVSQRLALQLDALINMVGVDHPITGHFTVSGQLQYDSDHKTIVLQQPELQQADIVGLSPSGTRLLRQAAGFAVTEKLDGAVLYRLSQDDQRIFGTQVAPERIEITRDGVVVHVKHN